LYEAITRYDTALGRFALAPLDLGPVGDQVILVLFGTGFRGISAQTAARLKMGGLDAGVLYAGPQGGFIGLDQVNILAPRALAGRNEIDMVLTTDGRAANTMRINLK
ncbi:MAG: hypothetical protein ACKV2V_00040, partial [Blastocatellia bacterium]